MKILTICIAIAISCVAHAQAAPISPILTLGITPLVVNQPASILVTVTNPTFSPVPTGQVIIDFGDGSEPTPLAISSTQAGTTHTYTTRGVFTITASYSGDTNFTPATKSLTAATILSSPVYKLRLFGDSLSDGSPGTWTVLLIAALGWSEDNESCGGCTGSDMAPAIYSSVVDDQFASTWMLGANEGPGPQLEHATLAENAWLAIPEGPAKLRAQNGSVTQSGSWVASDLFPTTGLRSSAAGSALTASISGSTIYVGLSSLTTTDYTVDVLIDGVDQGTASPVAVGPGRFFAADAYGLRYVVGGSADTAHVVQIVCQNAGTSGCYVDWIGSNGAAKRPNLPPYVWTGISYTDLQPDPQGTFPLKQQEVRTIESELQSDGLPIRVADIASVFNGPATPECVGTDGVHPTECGHLIEETVWLSAMSFLATEAQRIDIGPISPAVVGIPTTLTEGTATSGLSITYSLISGSGTINQSALTANQSGTYLIEADQPGDSTVLPAAPVQFSVPTVLPTKTSLSASSSSVDLGASVTLTATVTSGGGPVTSGTVTFLDGTTSLGSGSVNGNGVATLSTALLPVGANTLTASYAANTQFAASASTSISVTVVPPDFAIKIAVPTLTVLPNQTATTTITITPKNGFNQALAMSCAGLPPGMLCRFGTPATQADGSLTIGFSIGSSHCAQQGSASENSPPACRSYPPAISTVTVTAQTQAGLSHSAQLTLMSK